MPHNLIIFLANCRQLEWAGPNPEELELLFVLYLNIFRETPANLDDDVIVSGKDISFIQCVGNTIY